MTTCDGSGHAKVRVRSSNSLFLYWWVGVSGKPCTKITPSILLVVCLPLPITSNNLFQKTSYHMQQLGKNKMAGHSDVFPDMLRFMPLKKITIFNGQITVILSENSLKQYINHEATYLLLDNVFADCSGLGY